MKVVWVRFLYGVSILSGKIDFIDEYVRKINMSTYNEMVQITNDPSYSLLKTNDLGKFRPRKCGLFSCLVKRRSLFEEEYIDLLRTREAYTGYRGGSGDVWKKINAVIEDDPLLSILLSGVRYSISTHLSAFHRKMGSTYLSDPLLFSGRFNDIHRINFYFTYLFVRKSLGKVVSDDESIVGKKLGRVIGKIRKGKDSEVIEVGKMDISGSIRRMERVITFLDEVECEKCQLWGKIQFEGLKVALKLSKSASHIMKSERVFFVNFFMRLSVSVEENIDLRKCKMPHLMRGLIYWPEIVGSIIFGIGIFIGFKRFK